MDTFLEDAAARKPPQPVHLVYCRVGFRIESELLATSAR
jgi:hypothetical protein